MKVVMSILALAASVLIVEHGSAVAAALALRRSQQKDVKM